MATAFKIDNIIQPKQVAGIDIYLSAEGSMICNVLILKRSKNSIAIVNQYKDVQGLEELNPLINVKTPLSIVLNGKGILHKKIVITENETDASLLNKVLPNAKLSDFFLFKYMINEESGFVSVIRKNVLEPIIEQLKKQGFSLINISIGPFVISQLLPIIKSDSPDLTLQRFIVQTEEHRFANFKSTDITGETDVIIGNDAVSNYLLLAFAASFGELVNYSNANDILLVSELKKTYKNKRIFQLAGTALLIFYFFVLTVNYAVYSYYNKQALRLSAEVNVSRQLLIDLEKLRNERNEKSAFMSKTGLLQAGRTSFFADHIVQVIPSSIQLKEMTFNPLIKNTTDEKDILFDINAVFVKGSTKKNTELNEWIKTLRKMDWVRNVTLSNFTQDKEKNTGDFSIDLRIK